MTTTTRAAKAANPGPKQAPRPNGPRPSGKPAWAPPRKPTRG